MSRRRVAQISPDFESGLYRGLPSRQAVRILESHVQGRNARAHSLIGAKGFVFLPISCLAGRLIPRSINS